MKYARVALPVPLYRLFDYGIPAHINNICIGTRVTVPFGRKALVGIVISLENETTIPTNKLKEIQHVLDENALLTPQLMALAKWLSKYYIYPLGDTLSIMLPSLLRQGKALPTLKPHWCITPESISHSFSKQAKKQQAQYNLIASHGENGCEEQTLLNAGVQRVYLNKLQEKGLIASFFAEPKKTTASLAEQPLTLNAEQQTAVNSISNSINTAYTGFLLFGVTGSGKTEVYLQLIHHTLLQKKQALVLVPEIGLTPQTLSRFTQRFSANIVALHSRMNETERLASWAQLASGHAHIIIGTRSAVLAPFADLGLIIVDEEHDTSYKQQSTLRYHARDVALWRGQKETCPVVLGSATPSLESLHRVNTGKLTQLNLTKRAGNAKTAAFKIIDTRGKFLQSSLSDMALGAIEHTLNKNEQVLVFLNRRGYAPTLICEACGWVADCPRCDAKMTLHQTPYTFLKCHHCDWQAYKPKTCGDCGSPNLKTLGTGTAKLEELLAEKFANYPLFRIDADTTRKKNSWQKLYQHIHSDKPAILLGTQMLAKGHHFPNVTLVVMPNSDNGMISSDFRAPERTAQLMLQVAGRAGRGAKKGTVLIQSLQPQNPLLLQLVTQGYASFASGALVERQKLGLPPYRHSVLIHAESKSATQNTVFLNKTKALLLETSANQIQNQPIMWGALPAPMEKKASRYHTQLFILHNNRKQLHQLINNCWQAILALPEKGYIKVTLDIDPVSF